MIESLLNSLVPIFAVMGLGYAAGKKGKIDNKNVGQLNSLVMDFAIPCSLFAATASTPRAQLLAKWPLIFTLIVSMLVILGLVYVIQRRLYRLSSNESILQALTVGLPNYAAAGLPLVAAVFGSNNTVAVALAIATGAIFPSPITLAVLAANKEGGQAKSGAALVLSSIGAAFKRPIVFGPIIGIIFSLIGIHLLPFIQHSFSLMGQAAAGGACFVTGLVISAQRVSINGNVAFGVLLCNIIQPLLAYVILLALPVDPETAKITILLAALPSGFFAILFGLNFGVRTPVVGATLLASSVASIVTLAISIYLITIW